MWMPPYERRADEDTAGIGADNNEGCDTIGLRRASSRAGEGVMIVAPFPGKRSKVRQGPYPYKSIS